METLNWTAVIVGTVASFLAGWAYFSPRLLGRSWAVGSGIDQNPPASMPWMAMGLQLIALFILALVVGVTAQTEALGTALLAIAAGATLVMAQDAFSQKSTTAIFIDGGFVLVAGFLMILAQGLF